MKTTAVQVLCRTLALCLCVSGTAVWAQERTPASEEELEDYANAPALERDALDLLVQVMADLVELRETVLDLQASLDLFMDTVAEDLRVENERLRRAVRLRYERDTGLPPVPMPNRALIEDIVNGQGPTAGAPDPEVMEPREFSYTVVSEWGRTPEDAAALAGNTPSLKGMILAVPEWGGDEDLLTLGRELRAGFDDFDNINIEVFDDLEAARDFARRGVANPEHRVLNVSRFRDSGRDVILLIQDEVVREFPGNDAERVAPPP